MLKVTRGEALLIMKLITILACAHDTHIINSHSFLHSSHDLNDPPPINILV